MVDKGSYYNFIIFNTLNTDYTNTKFE